MIKFSQPRYILPLIMLPFIYVFFYLFNYTMASEEVQPSSVQETTSINPELPDPFLDNDDFKDKFDAFREAHKNKRDISAMQEIDRREEKADNPTALEAEISTNPFKPGQAIATPIQRSLVHSKSFQSKPVKELSEHEKQMQLFKAQMNYMDSLFREQSEPGTIDDWATRDTLGFKKKVNGQQSLDSPAASLRRPKDSSFVKIPGQMNALPLTVEKTNGIQSAHFNTILSDQTGLFIKAIIDEEIKVKKDSRIRIRLLEDVSIGDQHIPKGQYLYGRVSSFQAQRIEIQISSILLQKQILNISLDIYDLDGIKGLYVPESQFRELAKNMGSSMTSGQQLNIDAPTDNQMQLMYGLAKDAFNTTTQAASRSLRKNKAKLKYNTMVYLVNSSSSKEPQTL